MPKDQPQRKIYNGNTVIIQSGATAAPSAPVTDVPYLNVGNFINSTPILGEVKAMIFSSKGQNPIDKTIIYIVEASGQSADTVDIFKNDGTTQLFSIPSGGGVNVGSATGAVLGELYVSRDVAITPQAGAGAPGSGTWVKGALIVDSGGVLYICTTAGSPGTWAKVGAQ